METVIKVILCLIMLFLNITMFGPLGIILGILACLVIWSPKKED